MRWNWQDPDWPSFRFRPNLLADSEGLFLRQCGVVVGTVRHLPNEERLLLVIELISTEALKTSEIEGEVLDRDSVQSSLRRQFGLQGETAGSAPPEQGIAEMFGDLYRRWADPLDDATLFQWHKWLMQGRTGLRTVGDYRKHPEPMQVVSGRIDKPKIHFEAPPSSSVATEMTRFCHWFNATGPTGDTPLPTLARAGLAHLYFECIHPFEDGNGRIGRAVAEKALAQGAGQPSLTALSLLIQRRRNDYYAQLERANKTLDVEPWLNWFASLVLAAQAHTLQGLDFLLANTRLWDRLRGQLNTRQEKALSRLMRAGVDGFVGGLSASKYMALTGAPAATARRDLGHLVELGALRRTGQLKGTRYWLPHGQVATMATSPGSDPIRVPPG
ncbi:MAG TPA: Fic family protein [Steroidobacteraceae bacterium]|jgi:Fic family protein